MKDCDHYIHLFSDELDETIDPQKRTALQSHLRACSACREKLDSLRGVKNSLASLPRVKTSDSFDIVLRAKIRQEQRYQRSSSRSFSFFEFGWKTPAYAVVALLLMFVGAQFQKFTTMPSNTPTDTRIALEDALNGKIKYIDPGYLVISDLDSAHNRLRVFNYPDLDRAATIEDYESNRAKNVYVVRDEQLPDLREAPQNPARIRETDSFNQPQIKQAQFVF